MARFGWCHTGVSRLQSVCRRELPDGDAVGVEVGETAHRRVSDVGPRAGRMVHDTVHPKPWMVRLRIGLIGDHLRMDEVMVVGAFSGSTSSVLSQSTRSVNTSGKLK